MNDDIYLYKCSIENREAILSLEMMDQIGLIWSVSMKEMWNISFKDAL